MSKKEKDPNVIRGLGDMLKRMKGQIVEVHTKVLDSEGSYLVYRGFFRFKYDKYIMLTDVKVYKANVLTAERKELETKYKYILLKEDIVSAIVPQISDILMFE